MRLGIDTPLRVHGLDLSYFTGKLEGYLRGKGLRYELIEMDTRDFKACAKATGVAQMPQVEWTEGQWLTDTHLIIPFLESEFPQTSITPQDPSLLFISQLLEDFADEWLWRPALYYRWAKPKDARLMGTRLAEGMLRDIPAPLFARRSFITLRQQVHFLYKDGYSRKTAPRTEAHYLEALDALEAVLRVHPFVLGPRPTLADYGFFASMFRHFFSDPTPALIMRNRAPAVHEWVARVWNLNLSDFVDTPFPDSWPKELEGLMDILSREYLVYQQANESAWIQGRKSFEFDSAGTVYTLKTQPYRSWRYQRSRQRFAALPEEIKQQWQAAWPSAATALAVPVSKKVPPVVDGLPVRQAHKKRQVDRAWG